MKTTLLLISLTIWTQTYGQVNCSNDSIFYRIIATRPIPVIPCDTMYLITSRNYRRIFTQEIRQAELKKSLQAELSLQHQKNTLLDSLSKRHQRHIDSLDVYIKEKDFQTASMRLLTQQAILNTEQALLLARKNKKMAVGGGLLSGLFLMMLILK